MILSDVLVGRLRQGELQAVLIHEHDHVRRREPLRRAAVRAAADVLFYAPVMRWWSRRLAVRSELRADRAAIERVGRGPVAGALISLGSLGVPPMPEHQLVLYLGDGAGPGRAAAPGARPAAGPGGEPVLVGAAPWPSPTPTAWS